MEENIDEILDNLNMSSLLTQVIRRQALTMIPRRHESAMIMSGPPMVKVTSKVMIDKSFRSSE